MYLICYLLSDDLIATTFCPVTLMIVSCLHLGQYRGKFSSTVSGRTLIRVLLLQIGHSTHFSFSNAPPPYYLISQTGSNLAFAKPLPIYAVRLCVYAPGSYYSHSKSPCNFLKKCIYDIPPGIPIHTIIVHKVTISKFEIVNVQAIYNRTTGNEI